MFFPRPLTLTPMPVIYALRKGCEVISIGEGKNGFRLVTKCLQNGITKDQYISIDPNTGHMQGTHSMRYCEVDTTFKNAFKTPKNAIFRTNLEQLLQALHGYQWGQKPVLDNQNITGGWIGGVDDFVDSLLSLYEALCSKQKQWPTQLFQLKSLSDAATKGLIDNKKIRKLGLVWDPSHSKELQVGYYQAQGAGSINYTNKPDIAFTIK